MENLIIGKIGCTKKDVLWIPPKGDNICVVGPRNEY